VNKKARAILWFALGLGLLAAVALQADLGRSLQALARAAARPGRLLAAAALVALVHAGLALKWHVLSRLAGAPVRWRQSLRIFGTLVLVGTFTPGRAGELVVPMLMRGGGRLTGVALANRILESTWTLCVGAFAAFVVIGLRRLWMVAVVLALFIAITVVLSRPRLTAAVLAAVRACLRPFSRRRPVAWLLQQEQKHQADIQHFYAANQRLLRPGPLLVFSLVMLAVWLVAVQANTLLIHATVPSDGKAVTFMIVLALTSVSAVAAFISPTPGGLGVSEGAVVVFLAGLGFEKEAFVPFVLLSRLVLYAVVIAFYALSRLLGRTIEPPPDNAPV